MPIFHSLNLRTGAIALGLAVGLVGFGLEPGYAQITALDQDGAPISAAPSTGPRDFALPGAGLPYVHLAQARPGDYVERETIDPPAYRPPYETGRQVPSYGGSRESYSPPARGDDVYRAPPPRYEPREAGPPPVQRPTARQRRISRIATPRRRPPIATSHLRRDMRTRIRATAPIR